MKATGLNSEQTKRSNRLLVLRLLSTMGGGSRTELTQRVHLAKMTVSNIKTLLPGDIQKVWGLVTAVADYPRWRSDLGKTEILNEKQFRDYTKKFRSPHSAHRRNTSRILNLQRTDRFSRS